MGTLGDLLVVGDHDEGDPFGVYLPDELNDGVAVLGIEIARRLVGEDYRRRADQRPGHGDPLPFPTRHLGGDMVEPVTETDPL